MRALGRAAVYYVTLLAGPLAVLALATRTRRTRRTRRHDAYLDELRRQLQRTDHWLELTRAPELLPFWPPDHQPRITLPRSNP